MRVIYALLAAVGVLLFMFFVGGILMNYALREFVGDNAPQPSLWAWAVLWISLLILRNASTNVELTKVRRWLTGGNNDVPTEIHELRAIRQELKEAVQWADRQMDEGDSDGGPPRKRENDLG